MDVSLQSMPRPTTNCNLVDRHPPSFRQYAPAQSSDYSTQAFPVHRLEKIVVFIITHSPAIAVYVLGLDWKQQLNGSQILGYNTAASNWTGIQWRSYICAS
jgi:hypothetical protein